MTRAALDAGFADATHFSHSFRDTFGVNPAPVFRKIGRFEVTPGTDVNFPARSRRASVRIGL
jgi:AraC-like DNA-binding protein